MTGWQHHMIQALAMSHLAHDTAHVVQVKGLDGKWQPVRIPSSVKAIVLLNLQSYGGGRDIWGLADSNKDTQRGWKTPIFNDGMFEVCPLALLILMKQLVVPLARAVS